MIYIVDPAGTSRFMGFVRVVRGDDGRWRVFEGLTNR